MGVLTNVILIGKIIEKNNKSMFLGKTIFNKEMKIYFLDDNKKNMSLSSFKELILSMYESFEIGINIYNNIINGNQYVIIKNCLGNDGVYNSIINFKTLEILKQNNLIINMDIKKLINNNYRTLTLYDLINNKDLVLDYSVSIDNLNNIRNINKIFDLVENNIEINKNFKPFNLGIKELQYLNKLGNEPHKKMKFNSIEELKTFSRMYGYENTLKEYYFEYFYKLEEESKLIDLFLKFKKELTNNNFEIIKDIKSTILQYGLKNCPIYINYKIKINQNFRLDFNTFILNYIKYILNFYYNVVDEDKKHKLGYVSNNEIIFNEHILKNIYINDLIYTLSIPDDNEDFKITKLYGYNNYGKKFINNISNFGLSSSILEKLDELIK